MVIAEAGVPYPNENVGLNRGVRIAKPALLVFVNSSVAIDRGKRITRSLFSCIQDDC